MKKITALLACFTLTNFIHADNALASKNISDTKAKNYIDKPKIQQYDPLKKQQNTLFSTKQKSQICDANTNQNNNNGMCGTTDNHNNTNKNDQDQDQEQEK